MAERKVWMMDMKTRERAEVPVSQIPKYAKRGARIIPGWVKATDNAAMAGGIAGNIAGGIAGPALNAAAAGAFPPAAVNLPAAGLEGRMAGGVAGGVIGKLLNEGAYRAAGLGDAPGTVAGEAGNQALWGGIGEGIGGVGQAAGRTAIGASLASRGKELLQATGEMVRSRLPAGGFNMLPAAARNIPIIGPGLVKGSTAAAENFGAKTAARDAANAAGPMISAQPLEQQFTKMEGKLLGRSDSAAQLAALHNHYANFVDAWKAGKIPAADAQKFLTSLGEQSDAIWKAQGQRGQYIPQSERVVAQQAKQLSNTLRETMNKVVKGHAVTSKALSHAISAKNAINASESIPGLGRLAARSGVGMTVGGAIGGATNPDHRAGAAEGAALGLGLANSPESLSRLGLLLTDPTLQALGRNAPRFLLREKQ